VNILNKKLKKIVLPSLVLLGSVGGWLACGNDEPEQPYYQTEKQSQATAVVDTTWRSSHITEPNSKLISLNSGSINFDYGGEGFTHIYYTSTFEVPTGEISLLLPFPRELVLNRRYSLMYETFNPTDPFTVKQFLDRFIRYNNNKVDELSNRVIDQNLNGMIKMIERTQDNLR